MKLSFIRTTFGLAVILSCAALALAQGGARGQRGGGQRGGQQQQAEAQPAGAAILQRACGACHGVDVITTYHYESADGYRDIVTSMIGTGAQLTPQETPVLIDYLFVTYGKKPATPAAGQAASGGGAADPSKAILEGACTVCHGLDGLANHVYDTKDPYESLIRNMIGYGANVTDAQVTPLAEYMLKTYGKKPAAAPPANSTASAAPAGADPGKAILESACTVCHGLDGLANHNYDAKGPYESLVRSMVAYGANVSDAQMGPLVDYMFKTYGKK